jgi:hypothetical protein
MLITEGKKKSSRYRSSRLPQSLAKFDRDGLKAELSFAAKLPRRLLDAAVAINKEYALRRAPILARKDLARLSTFLSVRLPFSAPRFTRSLPIQ